MLAQFLGFDRSAEGTRGKTIEEVGDRLLLFRVGELTNRRDLTLD